MFSLKEMNQQTKSTIKLDGYIDIMDEQIIPTNVTDFFKRLFKPFYLEFIEGRILGAWRRAFDKERFKLKSRISYWNEFLPFWQGYIGRIMDSMIKSYWKNVRNYTRPRKPWGNK
jgi:hypothetical protein